MVPLMCAKVFLTGIAILSLGAAALAGPALPCFDVSDYCKGIAPGQEGAVLFAISNPPRRGQVWVCEGPGTACRALRGFPFMVSAFAGVPDGTRQALALFGWSGHCSVHLGDLRSGKTRELPTRARCVHGVAFAPSGRKLAVVGGLEHHLEGAGLVEVWNPEARAIIKRIDGLSSVCTSCAWSADSTLLAVGCYDGMIYVFEAEDGYRMTQIMGSDRRINALSFAGNERIVASCRFGPGDPAMHGAVRVWRLPGRSGEASEEQAELLASVGESSWVRSVEVIDGADLVLIGDELDDSLRLLSLESLDEVGRVHWDERVPCGVSAIAHLPGGDVAVGGNGTAIRFYRLELGKGPGEAGMVACGMARAQLGKGRTEKDTGGAVPAQRPVQGMDAGEQGGDGGAGAPEAGGGRSPTPAGGGEDEPAAAGGE